MALSPLRQILIGLLTGAMAVGCLRDGGRGRSSSQDSSVHMAPKATGRMAPTGTSPDGRRIAAYDVTQGAKKYRFEVFYPDGMIGNLSLRVADGGVALAAFDFVCDRSHCKPIRVDLGQSGATMDRYGILRTALSALVAGSPREPQLALIPLSPDILRGIIIVSVLFGALLLLSCQCFVPQCLNLWQRPGSLSRSDSDVELGIRSQTAQRIARDIVGPEARRQQELDRLAQAAVVVLDPDGHMRIGMPDRLQRGQFVALVDQASDLASAAGSASP